MSHRILVVANETASSESLRSLLLNEASELALEIMVVAPALVGRLDYWTTDDRNARAVAADRIDACLEALADCGLEATGQIGDARPLLAIDDALAVFAADEIVISTHPEGRSTWLERRVVERARERYDVPVRHVVGAEAVAER